jgi:UDP-N-acetylglucosamine 2-epimerase (non-hydrolysing)
MLLKIASVVGARPNFVKLAPVHKRISRDSDHTIIHTGQHYDYKLSEVFFKEFNLPAPNYNLEVGSGTACFQIGEMLKGIEKILADHKFDVVLVYGDTNSTFAGALAASRLGIKVAHVEAGLRSFDRRMPEETNRIMTDHISDFLFAPTKAAMKNLEREAVAGKVVYSGDLSVEVMNEAVAISEKSKILDTLGLDPKSFLLFTMHRAENTNSQDSLASIIQAFTDLKEETIVFPIHPRTERLLRERHLFSKLEACKNVKLISPVGYFDFIKLMLSANKIITDSGGVQKESYLLGVPCITIRRTTGWVEIIEAGWSILTDTDSGRIVQAVRHWNPKEERPSIFGDGQTSQVIRDTLLSVN